MAARSQTENARPGDILVVVHEFQARSPDELSLGRGDRIKLVERDDDFGDGWYLGMNTETGETGLFPEVYTRLATKPAAPTTASHQRTLPHSSAEPPQLHPDSQLAGPDDATNSQPARSSINSTPATGIEGKPDELHTSPLQVAPTTSQATASGRSSLPPTTQRSIAMALSGDVGHDDGVLASPVMHETLSVIDEHITDMSTPRQSLISKDIRANDSGSEYSSHHRLSYINGQETEEEEQNLHTEEEVMRWSPARVAEYLEDVGVDKKHCEIFKEQEITGEVLLGMDQATIFLKEFELGPVGPRLRTWLKIKALQQEVKTLKEVSKTLVPTFDESREPDADPVRNRATSMGAILPRIPNLHEGQGARGSAKPLPRANSSASHTPAPIVDAPSPLMHSAPSAPSPGTPTRPSAASVRSLNHNRRHSSIDYSINPPTPSKASHASSPAHKKTPSFDRNWTMGLAQPLSPPQDSLRPSSSNHAHSASTDATINEGGVGLSSIGSVDLDRGYFSGGELDNRKNRNVLRKRDSSNHSRNPSYGTESMRRAGYNKRHSRVGSTDSTMESTSPISAAARAYYGSSIRSHRSSGTFDFVRPLRPMNEGSPTVTKLGYADSPSIDKIANSPGIAGSETSSQGRASPSPAAHHLSFFNKKSRSSGLRAISDAITGGEKAHANAGAITASPVKESPLQSPARTGSSTPSGTSATKSLDLENADLKRLTGSSASAGGRRKSKKHGTSAYLRGRETITPQEAILGCDYSGWMKKKSSSLMTTWKTRLFVLRGRRLSYFYTENDTEEKGLIDISSHRVLPANNERITGLHASLTRASSTPTSPQNATIATAASTDSANGGDDDISGMFIFKLVPPRAGLQKGVQFTKPIVHYFAVDNVHQGRLWMAALMKATIDRDESLSVTTTYQQKTISLEKARATRQRPPALMDDADDEKASVGKRSKESIQEDVIHEEDGEQESEKGLAISGLDDAKALLDFADGAEAPPTPKSPPAEHEAKTSESGSLPPGLISPVG
ncbi:polarized growth protein Boi2 [Westerdykella ornata]|uniref:Polarized growth protein Boi2 n=1 Tax=Westerdykella ornata TaxID=318751 RepID=A0A6A6JLG5_WESOR|nr:polarized growth protein Boi2 [Westerdykella ornata]KAF2277075.1 polarized growth protein Boi2 [Westerdykella ornata]